jgi:hypothetical protein
MSQTYTPTTWTNDTPHASPVKYQIIDDSNGHLGDSATIAPVTTIDAGTPVDATHLNKMETGIQVATQQSLRPIAVAGATKTLASDAITITPGNGEGYYTVDTEAGVALDFLSTINGGSDGDIVFLIAANAARIVQVTSSGNIMLPTTWAGGLCFSSTIPVGFRYNAGASKWVPLSVFDPGVELWYNNSGGSVALGDLVHFDKSGITRFVTSTVQGNKGVLGVVADVSIANATWGWIAVKGRRRVNLNAAVTVGQALIQSTVTKLAIPNGGAVQDGYVGYVVDATNSPTYCMAEINPKTDRTGGQATLVSSSAGTPNFTFTSGTTFTAFSGFQTTTGTNKLLVVIVLATGNGGLNNITYAGQALTANDYGAGGGARCTIAYCIPTANSGNINIRYDTSSPTGQAFAFYFNDVNQSTPVGTLGTQAGTSTAPAASLTTVVGDYVLAGMAQASSTSTVSGRGASQVNLFNVPGNSPLAVIDKIDPATGTGTTSSWTTTVSAAWAAAAIQIHPL